MFVAPFHGEMFLFFLELPAKKQLCVCSIDGLAVCFYFSSEGLEDFKVLVEFFAGFASLKKEVGL